MSLHQIHAAIAPLRQALLEHPLYGNLRSPQALRIFMQHHVFAVWDFMSLLKSLQQQLCPAVVPWLPLKHPAAARLVNEIVLGEETDTDPEGHVASHFDLYRQAMRGFEASTHFIDQFVFSLRHGRTVHLSLQNAEAPPAIQAFVEHTFTVIDSNNPCRIAAAFTFGRESLLPELFQKIVDELASAAGSQLDAFQYYLQRHIDLDGDDHGPMATRLVETLCGQNPDNWQAAEQAATAALEARLKFWDAIAQAVQE